MSAVEIVTSTWFIPSYVGFVFGAIFGVALCAVTEWYMRTRL